MKLNTALAGALIAGFVLPAAAQAQGYYVVQNVHTKKCTITHEKPTSSTMTVVGPNGMVYKTMTEAESAMKTIKVCESD